jgi:hypothetical protein
MENDFRKQYEELAKKHKLPDIGELDAEFHVSCIDAKYFILSEVRHQMMDKASVYADFLSELLQPDTNLMNLYESHVLNDAEKKDAFEIFRFIMKWKRHSLEIGIANDEKSNAEFINSFLSEWKTIKAKLSRILSKVKTSWEIDSDETEKLGYFG